MSKLNEPFIQRLVLKEETYNRSFRIDGHDFNTEQLKAEITDGVLRINVPRMERKEQKVINVEVA